MKTENALNSILYKVLPHGVRDTFLRDLKEIEGTPLQKAVESAAFIPVAYRAQAIEAFNKWASIGAGLLVVFCFGGAAGPSAAALLVGLVLFGLVARDGYLHRKKLRKDSPPMVQYGVDSVGDAATAGLFTLVAQILMKEFTPPSALPFELLWRGSVICLPMIFVLKMMFRAKPDPNKPFHGEEVDPEKIYRKVWSLTILWWATFVGVCFANVTDIPNYWPDFLRTFIPTVSFGVWIAIQKDSLGRFNKIRSLFTDVEKVERGRKLANLAKGLRPGEPFYVGYVVIRIFMFVLIGLSLADAVLPLLTGQSVQASLVQAVGAMITGAASLLSWKYVQEAHRAAAQALNSNM
jgi:hypothetical protein